MLRAHKTNPSLLCVSPTLCYNLISKSLRNRPSEFYEPKSNNFSDITIIKETSAKIHCNEHSDTVSIVRCDGCNATDFIS